MQGSPSEDCSEALLAVLHGETGSSTADWGDNVQTGYKGPLFHWDEWS